MDRLPGRALSLSGAAHTFIVESSFVLGKRNYQSEFHATLKQSRPRLSQKKSVSRIQLQASNLIQ